MFFLPIWRFPADAIGARFDGNVDAMVRHAC
jgi:hypothetical protein